MVNAAIVLMDAIRIGYHLESAYGEGKGDADNTPHTSNIDLSGGIDWNAANKTFTLSWMSEAAKTVTLTADTTGGTIATVQAHVQAMINVQFTKNEFTVATSAGTFLTITKTTDEGHFVLADGTGALAQIGWTAAIYLQAAFKAQPFATGDQASFTAMNYIKADSNIGQKEYERELIRPIGRGGEYVLPFVKGIRYKEFKYTQYVQNATWITAAEQASAGNTLPNSYTIHCETVGESGAMDYFDIVGCVLIEYELTANPGEFPQETLTFSYYDVIDSVVITSFPHLDETQPSVWKDIQLTMDADVMVALSTITLTIRIITLDDMAVGKFTRYNPYVIRREMDLNAEYWIDTAQVLGDPRNIDINLFTVIVNNGWDTLQCTNMFVETDSVGEIPNEMGFFKHKSEVRMGGDCAISIT